MQQTIPDIINHINTLSTVHILPPYLYRTNRERTGTFYILDNNRHPFILPLWLNVERIKGLKTVELEPTLYICPHTKQDGMKRKEAVKIPFPSPSGQIFNVIHQLPTISQYFYRPKTQTP